MSSPTSRTLEALRKEGWFPWVVEFFNRFSNKRLDLWNFGDIIAIAPDQPPLIVQATGGYNGSARIKKILAEPMAKLWLSIGGRIQVHDWVQKAKGCRWRCRTTEITEEMFDE